MKETGKKKPNILLRFLTFLLTLALVVGALCLVLFRDQLNMDALKRYITYRSLTRDGSGQVDSFPYDGGAGDSFATLDGSLLVAGESGVRLYSPAGVLLAEEAMAMENPVVYAAGKYAAVYAAGGTALSLYNGSRQLLDLESEGKLLAASVNSSGWLAVTHQASGRKGAVTIYNPQQKKLMQFNFSSRFVMDALINEGGDTVAIITVGQGEGGFSSYLSLYSLAAGDPSGSDPLAECELGNSVTLSLRPSGGKLLALGDNRLSLCSWKGVLEAQYDYSDRYLKEFSLEGDGFSALLLGKYRAGSAADLVVVDGKGASKSTLPLNEQVLSLSAAGRYLGLLTADRLDIYTQDLELYSSLEGTQGARRVLMGADGSAMLIGSETARLYLPN